jgi:hypothetical protein
MQVAKAQFSLPRFARTAVGMLNGLLGAPECKTISHRLPVASFAGARFGPGAAHLRELLRLPSVRFHDRGRTVQDQAVR